MTERQQIIGMSPDEALSQTRADLNASRREMVLVAEIERLRAEIKRGRAAYEEAMLISRMIP